MTRYSGLKNVLLVIVVALAVWLPVPQQTTCRLQQGPTPELHIQYPGSCC